MWSCSSIRRSNCSCGTGIGAHDEPESLPTMVPEWVPTMNRNHCPRCAGIRSDYSYLDRFSGTNSEEYALVEEKLGIEKGGVGSFRLGKIIGEHFRFQDSRHNIGLQIVDVLANATQRALNGKLGIEGWEDIGSLLILKKTPIQFVRLDSDCEDDNQYAWTSFHNVLEVYRAKAKPLWLPHEDPYKWDHIFKSQPSAKIF